MAEEKYLINGVEYKLKEKYSLKDWGKIIKIIGGLGIEDNQQASINSLIMLFDGDKVNHLLNIIFTEEIKDEIYEDDFEEVSRAINNFFSRKKSLMKNIKASSVS